MTRLLLTTVTVLETVRVKLKVPHSVLCSVPALLILFYGHIFALGFCFQVHTMRPCSIAMQSNR